MRVAENSRKKQKRGSKSYYYKFFMSFIIVLFAPMLTIALVFFSSQSTIKEQIMIASQNTLHQFFQRVDGVVDEAQDLDLSLISNSDCKSYSRKIVDQSGKSAYYSWKVRQILGNFTNEKYRDIFIYYPNIDYVVSRNNASMHLQSYYDTYYGNRSESFWEGFREVAMCTAKKPILCSMNGGVTDSYLCIAMRQAYKQDNTYDYVVVVVLNSDYVTEILKGVECGDQDGISMILNSEKEVLFSTDSIGTSYHMEKYQGENLPYEEELGGEQYILQAEESKDNDVYYAYAVPSTYFWSKLFDLYIVCGLGTIASVVLGIFIAWKQTIKVYQPVGKIVNELQQQTAASYDAKNTTEFEFIKMLFDKEKKENLTLNRTIRSGVVFKRSNFIFSLLNGNRQIPEKTDDIFAENGITLCSDRFCVILLQMEQQGRLDKEMISFVITNVFEELFQREDRGYVLSLNDSKYVIWVNLMEGNDMAEVQGLLKEGETFFEQHMGMKLTIGVSTIREGMQGIYTAYKEAVQALKYSYLLGKERIIDYPEVAKREFKYLQTSEMKMLHVVTDYLAGNMAEEEAPCLVRELLEDYGVDISASMETVECFKFETISMFNRILMQEGFWNEEWKDGVLELLDKTTLAAFENHFAKLLMQLYHKKRATDEEKDICARALEYIEAHYKEEQLSRTVLGEIFGISHPYLSKLFKEKYQVSIADYITQTRIKNAKRQLRDTDRNVQEIAEQNGFVNSNSFIRAFKRQEGITPGGYRELFKG